MHQQLLITLSPEELKNLIQDAVDTALEKRNLNGAKEVYTGYLTVDQACAFTHS